MRRRQRVWSATSAVGNERRRQRGSASILGDDPPSAFGTPPPQSGRAHVRAPHVVFVTVSPTRTRRKQFADTLGQDNCFTQSTDWLRSNTEGSESKKHAAESKTKDVGGGHDMEMRDMEMQNFEANELKSSRSYRSRDVYHRAANSRPANECAQCREMIFLPEWSEYLDARRVRHLWECEACGYKFETLVCFVEDR
jgi:hypothetical protein